MYPITGINPMAIIACVLILAGLSLWVGRKDRSARPLGLIALPIAGLIGWTWFTDRPEWTAWMTLLGATLLFIIGMTRDEKNDDLWHYGALFVALFGKSIFWVIPEIGRLISGEVRFPIWVLLIILGLTAFVVTSIRSPKLRGAIKRRAVPNN